MISVFSSFKISLSALNWGKSSYVCIHLAGYASLLESQPWFHVNLTSDLKTRFLKVTANKQLQQENISVFYFSLHIRDYNFRLSEYDSHYNLKYVCITLFKKTKNMNIKMDSDAYGTRTSLLTKSVMVQIHGVCLLVCPVDLSFCLWGRFCQDRALHILWSVKCQGYKLNHYEFASLKWFCVSVWKTREKWFGRFILRLRCRFD